jgi:phosphatidylglycerol:prolipoprotein diacylglycerol transferase
MIGPYVHSIDPVIGAIGGVYLWWYGLSYTLGFLQIHLFLRRERLRLGLTPSQVYSLTLVFLVSVLVGGRAVEVAFDEWPFYREHPGLIPAFWLGGMATHGLLIGAAAGTWIFARWQRVPFLRLADALVIPGAFLMGVGRIGNFIDGQIVGSLTDVPWAVKFPDADGFRHPVVLYDGLKNLLLIPYLLWVRTQPNPPGAVAARFVFWYAFLRFFLDLFRNYPTHRLELGTGQTLNIVMTILGLVLLLRSRLRRLGRLPARDLAPVPPPEALVTPASMAQRAALIAALLFCLTMPSNWTQDIPARYGKRHADLEYSWLYPKVPAH